MPLLELKHLQKSYRGRRVVDNVSISVDAGEIVGLLGPNGAGKSTSFKMAVGMVRPENGSVTLDGADVTGLPTYQRARRGLGYLAQEPSIFRGLTVEENILAVLELTQSLSRSARMARLDELLDELDLKRLRKSKATTLSGGEKRRLEITRALAVRPKVLLLDEPFSGIDPIAIAEIQEIVRKLRREHQLGILLTDHSVRETLQITDRSYVIHEGKVFAEGAPQTIIDNPDVRRIYLGQDFEMAGIVPDQSAAGPAVPVAGAAVVAEAPVAVAEPVVEEAPAPPAEPPAGP